MDYLVNGFWAAFALLANMDDATFSAITATLVSTSYAMAASLLMGLPAGFAAALGITGLFCGMTNCPLTSLLISVELFGADGLLCYAVVCAVSYVCSGYRGLYSSQTILYSKLRAEFINVHTK